MNAFGFSLSRCLAIISISAFPFIPGATAAEFRGASWTPQKDRAALVHVPEGARRLRLQTRASADAPWTVVGVVHLEGRAGTLKMRLPDGIALEDVLLETSTADPFPYAFYQGQNSFGGNASPSPGGVRGGPEMLVPGVADNADVNPGGTTTVVEESDIWKWRDRTLYYFNSLRGLQVFDLSDFANPRRVAGLRMPAVGEDMYLIGAEHVALLANRYDSGWYGSSTPTRSEVVMIHHAGEALTEASRVPIEGTFIDSRLIGSTLCVVTRKTEMVSLANGGQTYVPKTNVYALDLADPAHPQVRGPLELTDDDTSWSWNTEVHATAEFLFVGTDYWRAGENTRTRVHVIDLRTPAQPLSVGARFELRGQLLNKFQLTYAAGILTTVSQAGGAVVETWDVTAALDQGTSIPKPLDSLLVGANEGLFGTRFDGDRVYVVTFRRIDPLFCVDLANPRDLRLLGELEVPGFSTYLEAFADGSRLMSVGVENGRVAVSLFDVADPGAPALKGRVRFGDDGHGSWSEANYDDKAIGFFQSEGLLVIPLSQWTTDHGYREGMQVLDVTAENVRGRGFIDHRFSARRGRLFDQTLVSISGTELVIVDLADRDRPAQVASLTIAWPVKEALPYGNSLVQLESGDSYVYDPNQAPRTARLRIAPKSNRDVLDADVDLGVAGEIAGATILGDTLYVILRSTEQRLVQGAEGQLWEWSSLLTTLVVDLAHAGGPHVQGAAPSPSAPNHWASGHLDAHWLSDGRLLWAPSDAGNSWFGCMRCPLAIDGVGMGAAIDIAGPFWWWGGGSEDFLVVDVIDHAKPRVIAREAIVPDSETAYWNSGRAFVTANNRLLASWTAWRQEGAIWLEESIVQEIDLSDSAAPRRGPKATVPGRLEGIHRTDAGGSVLFTSRTEVTPGPDDSTTWTSNALIDVLAYDGTQAFLLDTARAEGSANMSAATIGTHLLIATQPSSSTDEPKGALRVLGWDEATGKLKALPDVPVSAGWPSLSEHGGFVFAFNSGQIDVIAAHQLPAPPATASLHLDVPVWDQSNLQLDPDLPVAWQPVDSFGVERLDLGALPPSPQQRAARDRRAAEWHSLALLPVDVVPAGSLDGPGSLGAADDFRFTADDAAETYTQWQNRYFTEPFGPSAGVLGDPDGDGFDNYAEWAFDTSPLDPLSQPSITAAVVRLNPGDPERLVLVARLNPLAEVDELPIGSYLSLTPQISTDAASWQNVPRDEVELIVTPVRRMFVLPARPDASTVLGRLQVFFVIEG